MKIWIKDKRKDGKYSVIYGFNNGRRINKILTHEKLQSELKKTEDYKPTLSEEIDKENKWGTHLGPIS